MCYQLFNLFVSFTEENVFCLHVFFSSDASKCGVRHAQCDKTASLTYQKNISQWGDGFIICVASLQNSPLVGRNEWYNSGLNIFLNLNVNSVY